jgi:hypothetical protein
MAYISKKEILTAISSLEEINKKLPREELYVGFDEDDKIIVSFRNGTEKFSYSKKDFLEFVEECLNMTILENGTFFTKRRFFQIVEIGDIENHSFFYYEKKVSSRDSEGNSISLQFESAFTGYAALLCNGYHRDIQHPLGYTSLELCYKKTPVSIDIADATKRIDRFLFTMATTQNCVLYRANFIGLVDPTKNYDENAKDHSISLPPLVEYNEAITLFVSAVQTFSPDLELFGLYRVFEYFGPVVTRLEINDLLASKLKSPNVLNPDRRFLDEIVKLIRDYDKRQDDEQAIAMVFSACIDILNIINLLPSGVKTEALSKTSLKYIDASTPKNKIKKFNSVVGKILYSTRNSIVHAKANYQPSYYECPEQELSEFNNFLRAAAAQVIDWYNKLPDYQKI